MQEGRIKERGNENKLNTGKTRTIERKIGERNNWWRMEMEIRGPSVCEGERLKKERSQKNW